MRCKTCDYRLWNIAGRNCPECGAPFKPSDFEFRTNSVQFCCPHCQQDYYGTDRQGHLQPRSFHCVKCGELIDMDEMVVLPTSGVDEQQTAADSNQWLLRHDRGVIKSWFGTLGRGMGTPAALMRVTSEQSSVGQAWWFALITQTVIWSLAASLCCGFWTAISLAEYESIGVWDTIGMASSIWLMPIAGTMAFIGIWGAAAHILLRLSGQTAAGIGRTYQTLCYTSGANAFSLIPFPFNLMTFAPLLSMIWWSIVGMLGLQEAQRVSGGRAALAAFTPLVIVLVIVVGGFVAWVSMLGDMMSSPRMVSPSAQTVGDALRSYAADHDGNGPAHAALLLQDEYVDPQEFRSPFTETFIDDIPVADGTMAELVAMGDENQSRTLAAVVSRMPDNVIAHRVGDQVFTYHGIDFESAQTGLWIVVEVPDPVANAGVVDDSYNPDFRSIITLGGDNTWYSDPTDFNAALQAQNDLRAEASLPPLPDPAGVTHDKPATALPVLEKAIPGS